MSAPIQMTSQCTCTRTPVAGHECQGIQQQQQLREQQQQEVQQQGCSHTVLLNWQCWQQCPQSSSKQAHQDCSEQQQHHQQQPSLRTQQHRTASHLSASQASGLAARRSTRLSTIVWLWITVWVITCGSHAAARLSHMQTHNLRSLPPSRYLKQQHLHSFKLTSNLRHEYQLQGQLGYPGRTHHSNELHQVDPSSSGREGSSRSWSQGDGLTAARQLAVTTALVTMTQIWSAASAISSRLCSHIPRAIRNSHRSSSSTPTAKPMLGPSRKLLQQAAQLVPTPTPAPGLSAQPTPAASQKGPQDPAAAAALQVLAAEATAASAVVLEAVPRIWASRYHSQSVASIQEREQRASAGLVVDSAPPVATAPQQQQPEQQAQAAAASIHTGVAEPPDISSSSSGGGGSGGASGGGGVPVMAYKGPPPAPTTVIKSPGSGTASSDSTSTGDAAPVVTYAGLPDTSSQPGTPGSNSGGISIKTSTPVTVINPINVTTPLQQTTVQAGAGGGLLGGGLSDVLMVAAAMRPRLVVVPVILPGG